MTKKKSTPKLNKDILDIAKTILQSQFNQLVTFSKGGLLSSEFGKLFNEYCKTYIAILKEEREATNSLNLSSMTEEELKQALLKEITKGDTNGQSDNKTTAG
jgi:hypothetical protein